MSEQGFDPKTAPYLDGLDDDEVVVKPRGSRISPGPGALPMAGCSSAPG